MEKKIKDLTTDELRTLISDTVKNTLEGFIEDLLGFLSEELLKDVEEARKDYKNGWVKSFADFFDV